MRVKPKLPPINHQNRPKCKIKFTKKLNLKKTQFEME